MRPAAPASGSEVRKRRRVCILDIELTPMFGAHVFSSSLSSLRKRLSAPSAIIFWGVDLMNPNSRIRSA